MEPFLISEKRLAKLTATRQGRVSLAGLNFQAAYATARLASMLVRRPVLDLPDFPIRLRYDWGEDLDELCDDGCVVFTQCKRIVTIGQPSGVASVLQSFAAKWLSVPAARRNGVHFRLVCTDPRFRAGGKLPSAVADFGAEAEEHFLSALGTKPSDKSDRALWQADADAVGHTPLFRALWDRTDVLFLTPDAITGLPASPLLPAEQEGLELLLTFSRIDAAKQSEVVERLRRIVHDNLITFDPANETQVDYSSQRPRIRERADVANALASCRPMAGAGLPFDVVDRTFLSKQRQAERRQFVARQPDWADVVHGADERIKFVERSVTSDMRAKIIAELVEPLERGTERRLHMLFVVGAPGSGKTTLVRRIAAMLVDEGRVVVADAGIDAHEPAGSPQEYADPLEQLANAGRPVILLLDDPLYGDSAWIPVLKRLNRPGLKVAVLAPCPQMLFDRHRGSIANGVVKHLSIGAPTEAERAEMRRLYGRATNALMSTDEFLVITMEAAAGIPFNEIIRRLWLTLNDGRPIPENWESSAWTLRAFMVVCFFHRVYLPCPEPVLHSVLGGDGSAIDISTALAQLRAQEGWLLFRFAEHEWPSLAYQGGLVQTAHQRIAERAWDLRPMNWWDIGERIVQASVVVSQTSRYVGELAARLCISDQKNGEEFATHLVEAWLDPTNAGRIETRRICDLATALQIHGQRQIALRLAPLFHIRSKIPGDGWLAALQLFFLSGDDEGRFFPNDLDLAAIISGADFSIAPHRATRFFDRLPGPLKPSFTTRIFASFDGIAGWEPGVTLAAWLLGNAPRQAVLSRIQRIEAWLKAHPDDTSVRTSYLGLLSKQSLDAAELKRVIADTEAWLKAHLDDTSVRTGYLGLLSKQRLNPAQLKRVIADTEAWLKAHPNDTSVRTGYLGLPSKQRLDAAQLNRVITDTEAWLKGHPDDTSVRTGYLGLLSRQRLDALQLERVISDTEAWLKAHPDDTGVREGYVGLLSKQRLDNVPLRSSLATENKRKRLDATFQLSRIAAPDKPTSVPFRSQLEERIQAGIERVLKEAWTAVAPDTPVEARLKVARERAVEVISRLSPYIKRQVGAHFETKRWEPLKSCDPCS